jgi:undecaprenyl-diphosphatase
MDFSDVEGFDQGLANWFVGRRQPWLDAVMQAVTVLGNRPVLTAIGLVVVFWFMARRSFGTAAVALGTMLLAFWFTESVKQLVQRPRPELARAAWRIEDSLSFPSGHALNSMAVCAALALLTARRLKRAWLRYGLVAAAMLLSLLIGASRLYLGVHYFTDVVAGWVAGLALALTAAWIDERWAAPLKGSRHRL